TVLGMIGYILGERASKNTYPSTQRAFQKKVPTNVLLTVTSSATIVNTSKQWHTKYLTGSYPPAWSYQLLPSDFFDYSMCLGDVEWNRFSLAGINDVHIDICTIQSTDPETVLETI